MRFHTFGLILFTAIVLPDSVYAQNFTNVLVDNNASDGECTMIINPQSPGHLLIATNPDVLYRSSDDGLTWTRSNLSPFSSTNLIGDVALAANNSGQFFCQDLDNNLLFHTLRSSDYGATWNTETVFGDIGWTEDKNWLTLDHAPLSPFQGNLYCAWTRRSNSSTDPGYIFVNHSSDGGQSWSQRDTLDIDTSSTSVPPIGTGLAVGPAGEIGITWGGGFPNTIRFQKSINGGNNWLAAPVVVDNNVQPVNSYYANINHAILFSAQFTSLACDISGGPHNGNLYCVWDDVRNGPDNADIFLAKSTDGGQTWSTQRINDDMTTRNQVVPTVAVDPSSGWVYVSYLDARLNTDNFDDTLNYYVAWSNDGAQTFHNVRVSQQSSTWNYIHSDYMGMDAFGGEVHLLWSGGVSSQQIWTASATEAQMVAVGPELSQTPSILLYPAMPNPTIDFTTFDFEISQPASVAFTVTDLNGRVVAKPIDEKKYETGRHQIRLEQNTLSLAPGIYIATLTTSFGQCSRKFVISQ
ncbi:MAG TPA: T9SS type A sorting domain-containing protein [Bacteroidia bacterium]|nr:T9SS type A sorting domain-containing protein [Bacteroidia bacterium]